MHNPAQFFANKSITVMGIDPDGRGLQDAVFLAEAGADVVATDYAPAEELQASIDRLEGYENVEVVVGEHRMQDFKKTDIVIRAASAPLDSKYLKAAYDNNVSVEIDETLFLKYAPEVTAVGVTGTRGKSTVAHMIDTILQEHYGETQDTSVFLLGNVRGKAALPKLTEVEAGDVVVMELSSWQLQAFGQQKMSPEIAVFTTFMEDHLDYYCDDPDDPEQRKEAMQRYFEDKSQIYKHQLPDDRLIVGAGVAGHIEDNNSFTAVSAQDFPRGWDLRVVGEHNRLNAALATEAARSLDVPEGIIESALESFEGVEGRLEYCGEINGFDIYNDNNATTQDASVAGIAAIRDEGDSGESKELTLIAGGSDKQLEFDRLATVVNAQVDNLILLSGSGTENMKEAFEKEGEIEWDEFDDFRKAVDAAFAHTSDGGTILFSPAAASFNMFEDEYSRNDKFKDIIASKRSR